MSETPQPTSDKPRPWQVVASGAGLVLVVTALIVNLNSGDITPATTTTTQTTTGPSSTTTTEPGSTTTAPVTTTSAVTTLLPTTTGPLQTTYDVIVVGDGMGGATAAAVAARLGADTLLLSPVGYFGGQAGAAGVATMDEGGNRDVLRRSGIYKELVEYVRLRYGALGAGDCYFIDDPICPEPTVVDEFFRNLLAGAGVTVAPAGTVTDVVQDGTTVTGVEAGGIAYQAKVVIDATEFSDLYPLIEGLQYEVGDSKGCVQDTTWLAIRNWYSTGTAPGHLVPAENAIDQLRSLHGAAVVDVWLDHFRNEVVLTNPSGSGPSVLPWDLATETAYRALADSRADANGSGAPSITRTGVNFANDSSLSVAAIEDPAVREQEFRRALHVTYAYLWYLRWELGVTDWGVANDLRFEGSTRLLWDDLIPDGLEANLPPYPYVREARRLISAYNLGPADLADDVRGRHRFDDAVMLGGYFTDFHGCEPIEGISGYGLFEVPLGVFIPAQIDGFLPGIARAAGVSRVASAAIRTQPEEMWGGQVAGTLAGLAVSSGVQPRAVTTAAVQTQLRASGLVFFLP